MASPEAMAASMLKNVPEKTGKTLAEWHRILQKTSLEKHGELLDVLKIEHGITHGFANLIVTKFRESGSELAGDLVATQYGRRTKSHPFPDRLLRRWRQPATGRQIPRPR